MSSWTNAAILVRKGAPLQVERVQMPSVGDDQIAVKLVAAGICHTQLARIANPDVELPSLMGHEGAGYITRVGRRVSRLAEGDFVALSWVPHDTPKGRVAVKQIGARWRGDPVAGRLVTWTEQAVLWSGYATKVGDRTDHSLAAVLGCAVITGAGAVANGITIGSNNSLAVFGVGGVGLAAIAMARRQGASKIIAVDTNPAKFELARSMGATAVVDNRGADAPQQIARLTNGGADFALDCVGSSTVTRQCMESVIAGGPGAGNRGGTVVVVGLHSTSLATGIADLVRSHLTLRGSLGEGCPRTDFARYLKLGLDGLVTDCYRLDQINTACADLRSGKIIGRAVVKFG